MMPITLPYRFDTSRVVKAILRGALGLLLLVVVPGVLYSLILSQNVVAAVQMILVGAVASYFARLILKNLESSQGIISADAVLVSPGKLYGIPLAGPVGRFPLIKFKSVRVQLISAPIEVQGRQHERIYLVGKDGTPDVLIARTERRTGQSLAGC